MALSRIISDKSEILVENRDFFMPIAFDAPARGLRRNITILFETEKLERWVYQMMKKSLRMCVLVSTEYTNVTDTARRHRASSRAYA